jgi:hypothetical protein
MTVNLVIANKKNQVKLRMFLKRMKQKKLSKIRFHLQNLMKLVSQL